MKAGYPCGTPVPNALIPPCGAETVPVPSRRTQQFPQLSQHGTPALPPLPAPAGAAPGTAERGTFRGCKRCRTFRQGVSPKPRGLVPLVLSHPLAGVGVLLSQGQAGPREGLGAESRPSGLHVSLPGAAPRLQLLLLAPLPALRTAGEISRNSPFLRPRLPPVPWAREPRRGHLETLRGGGTWVSLSVQNLASRSSFS